MLIKLLIQELGDIAYAKNDHNNYMNAYDLTLDMMKRNTLIIMYNEPAMLKEFKQLWPSWRRYSSEYLKASETSEFMKNLFSQKSKDSPKGIGWVFTAIQGIESSYVRSFFLTGASLKNLTIFIIKGSRRKPQVAGRKSRCN